jgi:hypothetical protein
MASFPNDFNGDYTPSKTSLSLEDDHKIIQDRITAGGATPLGDLAAEAGVTLSASEGRVKLKEALTPQNLILQNATIPDSVTFKGDSQNRILSVRAVINREYLAAGLLSVTVGGEVAHSSTFTQPFSFTVTGEEAALFLENSVEDTAIIPAV